jgi:hypothetical protein
MVRKSGENAVEGTGLAGVRERAGAVRVAVTLAGRLSVVFSRWRRRELRRAGEHVLLDDIASTDVCDAKLKVQFVNECEVKAPAIRPGLGTPRRRTDRARLHHPQKRTHHASIPEPARNTSRPKEQRNHQHRAQGEDRRLQHLGQTVVKEGPMGTNRKGAHEPPTSVHLSPLLTQHQHNTKHSQT